MAKDIVRILKARMRSATRARGPVRTGLSESTLFYAYGVPGFSVSPEDRRQIEQELDQSKHPVAQARPIRMTLRAILRSPP